MYSSYGINPTLTTTRVASSAIWTIIAAILAVVGGIVLYFTFLSKKNDDRKLTKNLIPNCSIIYNIRIIWTNINKLLSILNDVDIWKCSSKSSI